MAFQLVDCSTVYLQWTPIGENGNNTIDTWSNDERINDIDRICCARPTPTHIKLHLCNVRRTKRDEKISEFSIFSASH